MVISTHLYISKVKWGQLRTQDNQELHEFRSDLAQDERTDVTWPTRDVIAQQDVRHLGELRQVVDLERETPTPDNNQN